MPREENYLSRSIGAKPPIQSYGQSGANQPTNGFNPYAAGSKVYGAGRSAPSIGNNMQNGYNDRDRKSAVRQNLLTKLSQGTIGGY